MSFSVESSVTNVNLLFERPIIRWRKALFSAHVIGFIQLSFEYYLSSGSATHIRSNTYLIRDLEMFLFLHQFIRHLRQLNNNVDEIFPVFLSLQKDRSNRGTANDALE